MLRIREGLTNVYGEGDVQCVKPIRIKHGKFQSAIKHTEGMLVPCGKCIACRIQKRKEWSLRMLHEKEFWDESIFITLTYDDNNLPVNNSLVKSDLQKFIKRLRKAIYPRNIKYFACGEYGSNTNRPHYHAIIFGLSLQPEDKQHVIDAWSKCDWSVNKIRSKSFGLAEPDSINYVAQYIDKKLSGEKAEEVYTRTGREPVFRLLSLGLGSRYCDGNADTLKTDLACKHRGAEHGLPRYYVKRLGLTGSEAIKAKALERDSEVVEHRTGVYVSSDQLYASGSVEDNRRNDDKRTGAQIQHERNLKAKTTIKESKL